jgi:hypothetical protein
MKNWWATHRFKNNDLMEEAKTWMSCLAQEHRNLFPETTSVSIPAASALINSLSIYVSFVYN